MGDTLFRPDDDDVSVSAQELPGDEPDTEEGDGDVAEDGDVVEQDTEGDDAPFTRTEWRNALVPAILLFVVMTVVALAWYLAWDTSPEEHRLSDIDETGTLNLLGQWMEDPTAYGYHAAAINLTLEKGDTITLDYSAHGPPDGIQVRLQHPLHPSDGINGTGGAMVYASSVGGNGTVQLFVTEAGAYQLYFWHPGTTRAPGPGDDPDDHTLAVVGYHLVVVRAHRP
ncbi:MAG: hypothetical protein JSW25_10210 [Thermoplasmata archaeon]|nr:MAG: hypothetical protein JSW25_10210 [Thermoplasmata archaeon]